MGAKDQKIKTRKESEILDWEIDEDLFCMKFRATLQKCNDLGNQPQNKLKHGLKYFKNPFNKEGFKRVIINSH
ncbi:hypothetical protein ACLGCB_05880 [Helicobacter pylori]